jgi:hypothetical protein
MTNAKRIGLAVVIAAALGLAAMPNVEAAGEETRPRVPRCAEDELIVGRGDYSGTSGTWSRYECAHIDDIGPEWIENDYRNAAVYATVRGSVCVHPRFWNREAGIRASVTETCERYR